MLWGVKTLESIFVGQRQNNIQASRASFGEWVSIYKVCGSAHTSTLNTSNDVQHHQTHSNKSWHLSDYRNTSFSDNQGAIDLMKNKITREQNISNVYHFIREAIANGVLTKLVYCQFVYFMYMY